MIGMEEEIIILTREGKRLPVNKGSSFSGDDLINTLNNNGDNGIYSFHITDSDEIFNMGINLQVDNKPILKASFTSKKVNLSDKELIRSLKNNAFLTFKVILAIHLEAIKLLFKGLRLKKKPVAPKSQIFYFNETNIIK